MNRVLKIAIMKAKPFSDTKEWCGAFTPSEILELIKLGVKPISDHDEYWAIKSKNAGQGSNNWFYFYPNNKFIEYKEGKVWKLQ